MSIMLINYSSLIQHRNSSHVLLPSKWSLEDWQVGLLKSKWLNGLLRSPKWGQGACIALGIWFAHNVVFNFMHTLNITYEDNIPCVGNRSLQVRLWSHKNSCAWLYATGSSSADFSRTTQRLRFMWSLFIRSSTK